jgi:tRNA A37 threonylcarbamoyladenosine synthetase subunit TsaC/SUA5/YrdC
VPPLVAWPGDVLGELARLAHAPVAATSANVSPSPADPGTQPAVTLREVADFLVAAELAALVVDGGACAHPFDMSIVDYRRAVPAWLPRLHSWDPNAPVDPR